MSIYTWRSGASAHPEDSVLQWFTDFTDRAGIVKAGDFLVSEKAGTPDMSVDVASGRAYVYDESLGTNSYPVRSTAIENVAVTANASGNPRKDSLVLFIDLSASPATDGTLVAKIQMVMGTPAASPVAPTDSEIFTSIGSANPFLRLADITVASGATSIVNANILDKRVMVALFSPSPEPFSSSMPRQALINPNFDIWQREVTYSGPFVDSTPYFLADHWHDAADDDGGTKPTLVRSRQILASGAIDKAFYYSRLNTNGAGTGLGANSFHIYGHKIDNGVRFLCGAGKYITVSFWARSDIVNKKIGVVYNQYYGSGGSPSALEQVPGTNWTLTSTWTKYTHTFLTNTLSGKTFGTFENDHIDFYFYYVWGTTRAPAVGATTAETYVGSGNIDIAQVQICSGMSALPFQPKPFDVDLRDCQRYYEKSYNYSQYAGLAAGNSPFQWDFGVNMNGYLASVAYKVKKNRSLSIAFNIYDVAGNLNRISTKTTALGAFTNNVTFTSSANYETGFNIYSVQNPIQGIAFHWTSEAEI